MGVCRCRRDCIRFVILYTKKGLHTGQENVHNFVWSDIATGSAAQAQHRHSTGTGQEAQAQHRKHRHRKCGTGAALCVYNNVENILKYVYNVPII